MQEKPTDFHGKLGIFLPFYLITPPKRFRGNPDRAPSLRALRLPHFYPGDAWLWAPMTSPSWHRTGAPLGTASGTKSRVGEKLQSHKVPAAAPCPSGIPGQGWSRGPRGALSAWPAAFQQPPKGSAAPAALSARLYVFH